MKFCGNCGLTLADNAKFCSNCGTAIGSSSERRKTVFDGEIHKCPNCGEILQTFESNCPTCGYELRGIDSTNSVREFAKKLDSIELERDNSWRKRDADGLTVTDSRKISLIQSFPIPNTKEDLFEFIVLAASNINIKRYNEYTSVSKSQERISDAWASKFEQAYEKAKLSFSYEQEFEKIQALHSSKLKEIKASKKEGKYSTLSLLCGFFVGFALLFLLIFFALRSDNKKIQAENARLESIVEEIYDCIENENYTMARAKAATLVFSGSTTKDGDKATERWDITRNEMLAVIDAAEQDSNQDPNTNTEQ